MHVAPANIAMNVLAQKSRCDPIGPGNEQHEGFACSVQSAFALHSRTCCMPMHDVPSIVGQLASA